MGAMLNKDTEMSTKNLYSRILLPALAVMAMLLPACGGGGGGGVQSQQALLDEINQKYAFTPNQPFDVIFACERSNSSLDYVFDFNSNGTFDLYSTLNNNQDVVFSGTYTYQNDEIHMLSSNTFLPLDETSIDIGALMGMVYRFQTPNMACIAMGHRYNDPAREFSTTVHYTCPITNIQAVSYDENAIEFVHRTMPFDLAVPGSSFRQRDRNITGTTQPNILRGYGIYRRDGDDFYVYFNNLFDDANILKGRFINGDTEISINQLEPDKGNCTL